MFERLLESIASARVRRLVRQFVRLVNRPLGSRGASRRRRLADRILGVGAPAVAPLIEMFDAISDSYRGPDDRRLEILKLVLRIGGRDAVDFVCRVALRDLWPEVRDKALYSLRQFGGERAVVVLADALSDPALRLRAVSALEQVGGPRAVELLCQALGDRDEHVRFCAVKALSAIGNPSAAPALCKVALQDPEGLNRAYAADALTRLHDSRTADHLWQAFCGPDSAVRTAAAYALVRLQDRRVADYFLTQALTATDAAAVENASAALSSVGALTHTDSKAVFAALSYDGHRYELPHGGQVSPDARRIVVHALSLQEHHVRRSAAYVLEKLGVPDDPPVEAWYAVGKGDWDRTRALGNAAVPALCFVAGDQDEPWERQHAAASVLSSMDVTAFSAESWRLIEASIDSGSWGRDDVHKLAERLVASPVEACRIRAMGLLERHELDPGLLAQLMGDGVTALRLRAVVRARHLCAKDVADRSDLLFTHPMEFTEKIGPRLLEASGDSSAEVRTIADAAIAEVRTAVLALARGSEGSRAAEAIRILTKVGPLDPKLAELLGPRASKWRCSCDAEDTSHGDITDWQRYGSWIEAAEAYVSACAAARHS